MMCHDTVLQFISYLFWEIRNRADRIIDHFHTDHNMTEQLPELRCNVLGFWGMQDAFNPVGGADKLAKGIKNCRVVLVNQCGHWVQVEHREMFNRTCIDFMKNG